VAVGAGGGTTVVGSPSQVQLFTAPITGAYVPTPQPDTTPFPIVSPSIRATSS
jgi:hypothetical protein